MAKLLNQDQLVLIIRKRKNRRIVTIATRTVRNG
jgi:hypothetical protein